VREQSEFRQHSGWLIPLIFLGAIVALSAAILAYDLRPVAGAFRDRGPTASVGRVALTIRGVTFRIPANYLENRSGGADVDVAAISALLPDMRGYSAADNALFASNAADSPVLHLLIKADTNSLDAQSRLQRVYKPYIAAPAGTAEPDGLTRYDFGPESGYGRDELYAGDDASNGLLLWLCERPAQDIASPNCLAIDRPVAPGVNISYRFKRAHLARWREISAGVNALVASFRKE
jgi:hypothetical protein